MQELQWTARVSVFKQLGNACYEWYRMASDEERLATGKLIVVDDILSEDELWERLAID